jgi:L-threonylcarbamoyladenylate synthase
VSDEAVQAIRSSKTVIIPTDTVYGLAADGYREAAARELYRLKGRPDTIPTALLAADLDAILDAVPELRGRAATLARRLLPGPYTLVLPNPSRRFRWLCGRDPEAIGVRVPRLPEVTRAVVERVGLLAATSANPHGAPAPARLEEIDLDLRARVGATVDGGPLPGTPSTVIDLTGPEPIVLREGATASAEALARLAAHPSAR